MTGTGISDDEEEDEDGGRIIEMDDDDEEEDEDDQGGRGFRSGMMEEEDKTVFYPGGIMELIYFDLFNTHSSSIMMMKNTLNPLVKRRIMRLIISDQIHCIKSIHNLFKMYPKENYLIRWQIL